MLVRNQTTIEQSEWRDDIDMGIESDNPFDMGWLNNVKQVLGDNVYLWMVPQNVPHDGIHYVTKNPYNL